jgi:hypothetical protein
MIDIGDMYDIETKYDYSFDATLGLHNRNLAYLEGCTLRRNENHQFDIVYHDPLNNKTRIMGELEIEI